MRVAKTLTTIFADPRLDSSVLSVELTTEWLEDSQPLDEWSNRFMMAKRSPQLEEGREVTEAALAAERIFADAAHNFRTPRKRKTPDTLEELMVGVSPYRRQISESDFDDCSPEP
jgi:hypothetical protein